MTDVAVGDVIRVVAEWDGPGGMLAQMVYHYIGDSGAPATFGQVGTNVLAAHQAAWLHIDNALVSTLIATVQEILKWDFTLNRWDGIDTRPFTALDGLTVGEMSPHGNAAMVKLFTASARRQARKYVPGFLETQVANGALIAGFLTNLGLYALDLDDDVVAGALTLSFGTFNTDPTSPLFETFSKATGAVQAESLTAYQRRRKPGTGI